METSKKTIIVASLCIALCGALFSTRQDHASPGAAISQGAESALVAADRTGGSAASERREALAPTFAATEHLRADQARDTSRLWPDLQPLDEEEHQRFEAAALQIDKLAKWGRVDQEEVNNFRQTLWELGDRGAAEFGREIAELSAEDVKKDHTATKKAMNRVMTLDYLAKAKRPGAVKVVADLASRPLPSADAKGTEGVQRFMTLQLFDTWTAADRGAARDFVASVPEADKEAYVYHYYIGLQLAGVEQSARLSEVSDAFGAEYIAKLQLDG